MVPSKLAALVGDTKGIENRVAQRTIMSSGFIALDFIIDYNGALVAKAVGGSAGNVLSILGGLGWSTIPLAGIGLDEAGDDILSELSRLGSDMRFVRRSEEIVTPIVYQHELTGDPRRTHSFSFNFSKYSEGSKPIFSSLSEDWFEKIPSTVCPTVMYVDRPIPGIIKLAEELKSRGALIVFEPSSIGVDPQIFDRALASADIIKYADDRLPQLGDYDLSKKIEICTMGSEGLKFKSPMNSRWEHIEAIQLPFVKDTSGAGDWCTAGLIYRCFSSNFAGQDIFNDLSKLREALTFGQVLSAMNCMTAGARGLASLLEASTILGEALNIFDAACVEKNSCLNVAMEEFYSLVIELKESNSSRSSRPPFCFGPLF